MVIENKYEYDSLLEVFDLMSERFKKITLDSCLEFDQMSDKKRLTKNELVQIICSVMEIKPEHLILKTRKREILQCRQMVYYFLSLYYEYSTTFIGRLFGQDHATVIHAKRHISDLIKSNKEIRNYYSQIKKLINEN